MIRKINTILSIALIVIFLLHGILGSFKLLGVGSVAGKALAWIGVDILCVHVFFGVILTVQSFRSSKATEGTNYLRKNTTFWTRRISGLALLVLIFFHIGLFGHEVHGSYVLFEFTTLRLVAQMLLIAALFVHIGVNIRPLLVSKGVIKAKQRRIDLWLILSVIVLFMAGAVISYYISWQW